jgi:hypothetical protein
MAWKISSGPQEVEPVADHARLRFDLHRNSEERDVFVEVAGTAWHSEPDSLPSPLDEVVRSRGRSEVERHLERPEPPSRLIVTTRGVIVVPRDGCYEPNDRVFVLHEGRWAEARVVELGEPNDAVTVKHTGVVNGEYQRDVIFVRRVGGDAVEPYRYEDVRATPY